MKAFDPIGALERLIAHDVRFVMIGGLAARLHGSPTVTDDLDVCHSLTPSNLERLAATLSEMKATLRGVNEDIPFVIDAKTLTRTTNLTLSTEFGTVDLLAHPPGGSGFDALDANAIGYGIAGMQVRVSSLEDLIRMKLASGRPKDLIEAEVLGALRDEIEGR